MTSNRLNMHKALSLCCNVFLACTQTTTCEIFNHRQIEWNCLSQTWLMAARGKKVVSSLFRISVSVWGSWRGLTHHYPLSPGEEEAWINLQSSQHFEEWDCTRQRQGHLMFSWKQTCFRVTHGWCEESCGATVSLFLLKTRSKAGRKLFGCTNLPMGSLFSSSKNFLKLALVEYSNRTQCNISFTWRARKQYNYSD